MEKFGYIAKDIRHHQWLQEIIDNDYDFTEEDGVFRVNNVKEYVYQDLQNYRKLIKRHHISIYEFIGNSHMQYTLFRFMENMVVIEECRFTVKNHQLSLDILNTERIPYHAFPNGYIYIACGYNKKMTYPTWTNTLQYDYTNPTSTWSTNKRLLMNRLNRSTTYKRKDIIIISRVPVYKYSILRIDAIDQKTHKLVFKYLNTVPKNHKEYVNHVAKLSCEDDWYYDNKLNLRMRTKINFKDSQLYGYS